MAVFVAVTALGALALVLTTLLVVAGRAFAVAEDPRLRPLVAALPGNNCGACGYPGCQAFAEALLNTETRPALCTVSPVQNRQAIADYLGVDVGAARRLTARLACAGGSNVARFRARYAGPRNCNAAAQVGGGGKSCAWGCLGYGDCEAVCDFAAISMDAHDLPRVDDDLCTACGDCVDVCPKDLFSLEPVEQHLWVACNNPVHGDVLLQDCEVACTACAKCAFDAPGIVSMQNNLPIIDHKRYHAGAEPRAAIERCPTGAIVWLENNAVSKGREAKLIIRQGALPDAVS